MEETRQKNLEAGFITAHEIATFAYCPEAWRLQYGLGLKGGNAESLEAGTRHHRGKGFIEQLAGWLMLVGQLVVFLAGLWLLWWMGGW
jgi:hypothetical protein